MLGEAETRMRANTDWFKDAGWGVFTHYFAENVAVGKDTTAIYRSVDDLERGSEIVRVKL